MEGVHKKNARVLFYIGLSIFFTLVLFLGVVVVILLFHYSSADSMLENEKEPYDYKFLRIDHETGEKHHGFSKSYNEIDTYESYRDKEGNIHALSKLGGKEYVCTGSCYCDINNSNERRTNNPMHGVYRVFLVGMTVVVVVFAAVFIYIEKKMATEDLTKQCNEEFKDTCDGEVVGEIDTCEEVTPPETFAGVVEDDGVIEEMGDSIEEIEKQEENNIEVVPPTTKQEEEEKETPKKNDGKRHRYLCQGYCISKKKLDFKSVIKNDQTVCEDEVRSGILTSTTYPKDNEEQELLDARERFRTEVLFYYCEMFFCESGKANEENIECYFGDSTD